MCLCVCGEGSEREHLWALAYTTLFTLFKVSSPGWRGLVNFSGNSIPEEDKRRTNLFLGQEETLSTPLPKRKEEAKSAQGCADSPRVLRENSSPNKHYFCWPKTVALEGRLCCASC